MDRGGSRSSGRTARRAKSTSSKTIELQSKRRPTHPGELFRDIVLPELGLSVSKAARQLGVSRQTLHAIMSGRSAVTAEMALRLGRFCGNGPGLWLRMQQAFDLWEAQAQLEGKLDAIPVYNVAAE
ncbi:MAG: HigA family addiction module antidote protein [Alphaproteobacteria bacterium]|nr:HigA family addiction module antidote protein [Alphaproteobacteria bacterium]